MCSSKKSKLTWHKIKNKKTLVLYLSTIYKLTCLTPKGLNVRGVTKPVLGSVT
jgi:hypothetical protein